MNRRLPAPVVKLPDCSSQLFPLLFLCLSRKHTVAVFFRRQIPLPAVIPKDFNSISPNPLPIAKFRQIRLFESSDNGIIALDTALSREQIDKYAGCQFPFSPKPLITTDRFFTVGTETNIITARPHDIIMGGNAVAVHLPLHPYQAFIHLPSLQMICCSSHRCLSPEIGKQAGRAAVFKPEHDALFLFKTGIFCNPRQFERLFADQHDMQAAVVENDRMPQ